MMRVGYQAGDGPQDSEWFYFEVRRTGNDVSFVEGNISVVFFIDVEVLYKALPKEVIERGTAFLEVLKNAAGQRFRRHERGLQTVICSEVTFDLSFSTMMRGRQILPPSHAI